MKAIVLQENLIKGLNTVNRIIGKNLMLPILNNVLIKCENSRITLTATNLEIAIITSIGANIEKPGELTVPARLLTEFVMSNSDKNITLESDGNNLKCLSEKYQAIINGLPVATMELKNKLTRQNVADAVEQYKKHRDPRELVFQFKRGIAHFAVDDQQIEFCTKLEGMSSWFLRLRAKTLFYTVAIAVLLKALGMILLHQQEIARNVNEGCRSVRRSKSAI
ncbi:MAG: type I restriction enzyme, R subunit, partial [Candidatus Berkelbacteria bacterium Licking1014_85]